MITYQEIYDLLRKEKYNEALQELPKNFLVELAQYINEKREMINKETKSIFSDTINMTRKQLDNTMAIIREIITLREKKILNLALVSSKTGVSKKDVENMLKYEKELFEAITKKLEDNQINVDKTLNGENKEGKDLKNNLMIRFKEEVPKFLDLEGKEMGPFKRGDMANLSQDIAKILLEDEKAEKIYDSE
jgi:DNA replication initiation complex subunit (GINS family)